MSSAVADLETGLQGMLGLKPPGVSGSRIQGLTALCTANIQSESVLIQKLFTHFKKTPGTHKLGVLYVVDSVTRKWNEQAKANGQPISSDAQDGTYGAAVNRVTELMPVLMNDISTTAPPDQKEKLKKLIEIWEKGQTFPLKMLNTFKQKLDEPTSTTPEGTPPRGMQEVYNAQTSTAVPAAASASAPGPNPAANTTSILEALANIARQNTSTVAVTPNPAGPSNPQSTPLAPSNPASTMAMNPSFPFPSSTQPVIPPSSAAFPSVPFPMPGNGVSTFNSTASAPIAPYGTAPVPATAQPMVDPALQQQIMIIKTLAEQGVPQEQWAGIIAAITAVGGNGIPNAAGAAATQNPNSWGSRPDASRDNGPDALRSPNSRARRRSRSASPTRGWGGREAGYDSYGRNSPGRGRGNDYRQRSPVERHRSPSEEPFIVPIDHNRWVQYDSTLPDGCVKVLSRTLFVGGVQVSDRELRREFAQYGSVQTCIVNKEKRHAFVKMFSRDEAVRAKDEMEVNRNPDSSLRTRWGVGYGPRDCCNYQTGISIIPISKLTEADRKWFLSADYGGSGGRPIVTGMVVEEPDIEIGAGVSSKAISRRMVTDRGSFNIRSDNKRDRDRDDEEHMPRGRFRVPEPKREEYRNDRDEPRNDQSMAGFQLPAGFPQLAFANGMPMLPPGFQFPGMPQPPPPGR